MDRNAWVEACEALPIFPLPRVVLMPRDLLPLHVFEPRYRALVAHCVARDGLLGIATLQPGYEADYDGQPPIFAEIGVGAIVRHQPLADGRSNVVVQAVGRCRVVGELPSPHPFRLVRAEPIEDDPDAPDLPELRALVLQLGAFSDRATEEASRIAGLPSEEMLDELARRMLEQPDERRAWLVTRSVAEKARLLEGRLAELVGDRPPVGEA